MPFLVKMVEGLLGLVERTQDFATFCLCKHKGSVSRSPNQLLISMWTVAPIQVSAAVLTGEEILPKGFHKMTQSYSKPEISDFHSNVM